MPPLVCPRVTARGRVFQHRAGFISDGWLLARFLDMFRERRAREERMLVENRGIASHAHVIGHAEGQPEQVIRAS